MRRRRAICHPAYYTVTDDDTIGNTIIDAGAIGYPAGYTTTFARADRITHTTAHEHTDAFGVTFTHSHPHAGRVHAHSYPSGYGHRVKENHGA